MKPDFEGARFKREEGFSLVEAMMAVGLTLLALGTALMLNGHQLKLVKSTSESNASSLLLQERIERFRTMSWIDFTNATYLANEFLPTRPDAAKFLPNISETVRLDPWPPPAPPPATPDPTYGYIEVKYDTGETPRPVSTGIANDSSKSLANQSQAKVEISVTWEGKGGRKRTRSYASVISIAGVNKLNLPGFGSDDDDFFGTPTPSSGTPTPNPDATPTPEPATPTPSPATPTPVPDDGNGNGNGNSNGNANGLGNSGGQSGQG